MFYLTKSLLFANTWPTGYTWFLATSDLFEKIKSELTRSHFIQEMRRQKQWRSLKVYDRWSDGGVHQYCRLSIQERTITEACRVYFSLLFNERRHMNRLPWGDSCCAQILFILLYKVYAKSLINIDVLFWPTFNCIRTLSRYDLR